jgi:hypothetical protein
MGHDTETEYCMNFIDTGMAMMHMMMMMTMTMMTMTMTTTI